MTVNEVRDRVRARFPVLPPLPDSPRLDQLINDADLGLIYDEAERGYHSPTRAADTKDLASRQATITAPVNQQLVTGGRSGHRLTESVATRSFLALGVDAERIDRAVGALRIRSAPRSSMSPRSHRGHARTSRNSRPAMGSGPGRRCSPARQPGRRRPRGPRPAKPARRRSSHRVAAAAAPEGTRPVLLTEIAPLARYGHLTMLSRWADLGVHRTQAIWVLVPQLSGQPRAPSSTGARCHSLRPASSSASTPTGSTPRPTVSAAEGMS